MGRHGGGPVLENEFSGSSSGAVVQSGRIEQVHFHAADPGRPATPRQLPPLTTLFTGRREDCEWLDREWERSCARHTGTLFVISGTAGVGKSSLAVAWAQAHCGDFPDGQLYADLAGYSREQPSNSEDILGAFLRALGVVPDRVPVQLAERVALLRTTTHGRRICVLLDNALSAAQVRILAIAAPGCVTMVTTRGSISGLAMDGASFHQLDPWHPDLGVIFIERALGEERVRQEPDAARRVTELCGGLPLALGVAVAKLKSRPRWTLGRLAEALARDEGQLELLEVGEGSAVMPALDGSYQVLDDEHARLYRALGRCPVLWFEPVMVAAVLDSSVEEAEERVDTLIEANLLEALDERGERHRFHDLVRLHAAHCAEQAPSREGDEAFGRLLDFLLASATAAEEIMTPSHRILARDFRYKPVASMRFSGEPQALDWLDRQRPNLMAVLRYCARRELHRDVWQLADAMWPLFLRLRYMEDRLEALTMAAAAARADGDRAAQGSLLLTLAYSLMMHERLSEAADCCDQSMEMYRQLDDERGLAQACDGHALIHVRRGEWDEAEALYLQALRLRERVGYRRGIALAYRGLGKVAAAQGRYEQAEEYLQRSQIGLEAEGDLYDAASSQALRAQAVADRGDLDRALRLLDETSVRMRSTGSSFGQGLLLEMYGNVHRALGNEPLAVESYQQAAELFASNDPIAAERVRLRLSESFDATVEPRTNKWRL
jgi:tetratricopeptide (TPR) repeat protein